VSRSATYLYAISRPIPPVALVGLRGIDGGFVRALPVGELTCVVGSVCLDDFDDDALGRNLENLAWLERIARQHDDVVREVAALAATVPLRLATICSDDAAAAERVQAMAAEARQALEHLDGREEWGVKLFDVAAPAPAAVGSAAGASSGLDYLRRRRDELAQRAERAEQAADGAEAAFSELAALAVQARRHRLQDPQLSGVRSPMLLNAAFLVDRGRVDEFRAVVDRLAAERPEGAVVLTGPWPGYSFAGLQQS
jgi:hypothetical protein